MFRGFLFIKWRNICLFRLLHATTHSVASFLGNFLSKGLKTNQLEVNTDEKTLRAIARLKEPRDLFALPKDKEYDCAQQAPRWPIECQVIEERITHIVSVPEEPEPYNPTTGDELKPRPVGEENGVVVFNYNPISAVNYDKPKKKSKRHSSSDSDISSSESRGSSLERNAPDRHKLKKRGSFAKLLSSMHRHSSSNSNDEFDYFDDDDDDITSNMSLSKNKRDNAKKNDLDNVWANKSPEYSPATPTFIKSQFGKDLSKTQREIANMAKSVSPVRLIQKSPPARPSIPVLDLSLSALSRCSSSSSLTSDLDELNNGDDDDGNKTLRETVTKTKGDKTPQSKRQENSKLSSPDKQYFGKFLEELAGPRLIARTPRTSVTSETPTQETLNNPDAKNRDKESDRDKSTEYTSFDSFEPQFSRSSVGGSKIIANCHPTNPDYDGLVFESRFESGNLAKAVMITETYYELYLRSDLYTSRSKQWFYFRVKNTKKHLIYRFSIVNLVKSDSLYNEGMRPLMYSEINAKQKQWGWRRCGTNVCYFRNDDENSTDDDDDNCSYTLTFNIEFPNDKDTVYFAHSYPYTYSDLQDYLMAIQKDPLKSKFCKLRLLCRSLAGNNVYYLTVTSPTNDEEILKKKKAIIVSARVHPSETPSSWMMKGLMDFITSDTAVAKRLRHRFIFKVIPMLNPDGVIVGNTRNSLTGKDLNRQYRTVIRETYPSIWYTKAMIKRLIDESNVALYCDMHAHSRKHNIFVYGCENKRNPEKRLTEQVFPLMLHKNVSEKFSFESCKFKIQRSKEGTGRIVVWMLGITNSYTIEASFGGSSLGSRKGTHFNTADYEHMGRVFCETLLDYGDESPVKERLRLKIIQRLLREGSSADEPLNIPLTDYSSDEGGIGSNSDNDGRATFSASDFEGPCCAPLTAPPPTPENISDNRRLKYKRMRKIMTELDRIYFQPLFQKKFRFFMRSRRLKQKRSAGKDRKKSKTVESNLTISKRSAGGAEARSDDNSTESPENSTDKETPQLANPAIPNILTDPQKFEEINEAFVKNSQHRARRKKKNKTDSGGNEVQRIKVSRMMRLWLSERNIHITRHKKNKKVKPRHKTTLIRKKSDPARIALDLPTTDPGSDLIFSTDDEYYLQSSDSEFVPMRINRTMPRTRTRRLLMQSDLQRRYIEEIGDGSELFTIPSQTSISPKIQKNVITYRPAPPPPCPPLSKHISSKLGEFPSFEFETARRTTSWHNLHNKTLTKPRIQNPYNSLNPQTSPATEHQLSTSKKIWAGHHTPLATGGEMSNRPLSWTTPPVIGPQPDRERAPKKLEGCESLLNACSQKLRTWQQQESAKASATLTPKKQLSTYKFNFIIPEMTEEERTLRIFRQVGLTKQEQIAPTKQQIKELKGKRRKNTLTNLAESTRFISCRLTKSKTRSSLQLASQQVSKSNSVNVSNVPSSNKLTLQVSRSSKFKTGGLVATAIQNAKKSKSKLRISTKASSQVMVLGVNTKSAAIINSQESAINSKCLSGKNMTASKPKARKSTTKSPSGITLVGRVRATLKKKSSLMIAASHTKAGQGNAKASKAAAMIGPSTSNIADTRGDGGDDGGGCSGSAILGRGLHKKASYHILN